MSASELRAFPPEYASRAKRRVASLIEDSKRDPATGPAALETVGRWTAADFARLEESSAAGRMAGEPASTADAPARAGIPPTVKRGEHRFGEYLKANEYVDLVLSDGKVKTVLKRSGLNGSAAFIDWINFTIHESTVASLGDSGMPLTDRDVVCALSVELMRILGYGITRQCDRGRNFYRDSYELGDGMGFVCHGGQRNTILVMISGEGVAAATVGWQYRLKHFLETAAVNPKLTRVDVAHDCFNGEYTVDQADADYVDGGFRLPKSPSDPDCEHRGNWRRINGKGRSFYVGHRTSGKFCRVYEKGKQLGDASSVWVRVEVEYKSVDRVLPLDILVNPGMYLAGAYPAFDWIQAEQDRIATIRETKVVEKSAKEDWIQRVAGPDLAVLVELEPGETGPEKAWNLIQRIKDESRLPKWASIPSAEFCRGFIHESDTSATAGVPVGNADIRTHFENEVLA